MSRVVKISSTNTRANLLPSASGYLWAQRTTMLSSHYQNVGTRFNEPLEVRCETSNDVRGDRDCPAPSFTRGKARWRPLTGRASGLRRLSWLL